MCISRKRTWVVNVKTSKTTFNNDQPRSGKEKDLWLETLWKKVNCLKELPINQLCHSKHQLTWKTNEKLWEIAQLSRPLNIHGFPCNLNLIVQCPCFKNYQKNRNSKKLKKIKNWNNLTKLQNFQKTFKFSKFYQISPKFTKFLQSSPKFRISL